MWYNRREVNNLAKTLYCKKCNMDVPEGEACPVCGKTPPASSMRVAWMYARQRALDWMSWNAVMRIAVPVLSAATALGLVLELLLGGGAGVRMQQIHGPQGRFGAAGPGQPGAVGTGAGSVGTQQSRAASARRGCHPPKIP